MSKPQAKKKPHKAAEGCEVGDHVFADHPEHGAMAVKILSKGADGFHGRAEDGKRHALGWDTVRGHKARKMGNYSVVDRGVDGALLEDEKGRRRFIAGEVPDPAAAATTPEPKPDDPLTGGMDRLSKATFMLPDGPLLLLKAQTISNRPGLALVKLTDKAGHTTQRWKKTAPDEPKERQEPRVDPSKPVPEPKATPDVRANAADRWKTSDPNAKPGAPARKEPTIAKPAAAAPAPAKPRETPEESKAKYLLMRNQVRQDRKDMHGHIAATSAKMDGKPAPAPMSAEDKRKVMEGDVPPPKTLSAEGQAAQQPKMEDAPELKGGSESAGGGGGVVRHETGKGTMSEGEAAASFKEEDKKAAMKHGDTVSFRHGDVVGTGKIVGSGKDGVTVHDGEREHQVRHEALEGKAPDPIEATDTGTPATTKSLFDKKELEHLPAKAKQPVADREALYKASGEALAHLKSWLDQGKGVCSQMGYQTMTVSAGKADYSKPGGMLFIAPLKGEDRAAEKVANDYGGDWSMLKDVVRCSIAVDTMDDLEDALGQLQKSGMILAQQPKDRFAKPTAEGYRDLMMNVKFPNGLIGEVQLHLKSMLQAKKEGHKPYEIMRTIDGKPREQWSEEDGAKWQAAFDQSRQIYNSAWGSASQAPPTKVAA